MAVYILRESCVNKKKRHEKACWEQTHSLTKAPPPPVGVLPDSFSWKYFPSSARASEQASKRRCFPEWCCLCSVAVIELDALALMWIMALISSPYTLSAAVGEWCGRRHFCGTQFYGENYYCGAVPSRWVDLWAGEEVVCYSFDSEKLWASVELSAA